MFVVSNDNLLAIIAYLNPYLILFPLKIIETSVPVNVSPAPVDFTTFSHLFTGIISTPSLDNNFIYEHLFVIKEQTPVLFIILFDFFYEPIMLDKYLS